MLGGRVCTLLLSSRIDLDDAAPGLHWLEWSLLSKGLECVFELTDCGEYTFETRGCVEPAWTPVGNIMAEPVLFAPVDTRLPGEPSEAHVDTSGAGAT
jgi:hypothetical protein